MADKLSMRIQIYGETLIVNSWAALLALIPPRKEEFGVGCDQDMVMQMISMADSYEEAKYLCGGLPQVDVNDKVSRDIGK